jgi:hypothetical protein
MMITRHHLKGDAESVAIYSPCERYRYRLTRVWDPKGPKALFVMLNPSTATEVQNDPTVERCERLICAWGTHGDHLGRGPQVEALLRATRRPLFHLGLSQAGHPKHPLYIGYDRQPEVWSIG